MYRYQNRGVLIRTESQIAYVFKVYVIMFVYHGSGFLSLNLQIPIIVDWLGNGITHGDLISNLSWNKTNVCNAFLFEYEESPFWVDLIDNYGTITMHISWSNDPIKKKLDSNIQAFFVIKILLIWVGLRKKHPCG